jgi:hypothetical protein
LRDQPGLFGPVASDATVRRAGIDAKVLTRLRAARGGRWTVLGDLAQELIEAAHSGLLDTQAAQGGQDRASQAGLVIVDGLRFDAFLRGDLFDPQVGERADVGVPGDLVVVRGDAVAQLLLQRRMAAGPVLAVVSTSRVLPS